MFLGHFGLAFGAKKIAPATSLATLFVAAQFADLLWPTLLLLGIERVEIAPGITRITPLDFVSYPYSHSLAMLVVWGVLLAYLMKEWFVGVLVVSHWLLDFIMHRPDMPLAPGLPVRFGLGLWNFIGPTIVLEFLLFGAGIAIYLRVTRARNRAGQVALWTLAGVLTIFYLAATFGPPPPDVSTLAWSAQGIWLLVAWAAWTDRHRELR